MVNLPYHDELMYIDNELKGLDINYLEKESEMITKMLLIRDEHEKKAFRITSIVKNDYLFKKEPMNKKYLATYMHDKVLDVCCQYWKNMGFYTYKEAFINELMNNYRIKGHADIIIQNKCQLMLGEVKNYLESTVNKDEFSYFVHQILVYCYFLKIKVAFLFINNPKRYSNVTVFKININESNVNYIKSFINRSLVIPNYIDIFKYKKPD